MPHLKVSILLMAILAGTKGLHLLDEPKVDTFFNDPFFSKPLNIDPFVNDPFFNTGFDQQRQSGNSFRSNVMMKESVYQGTDQQPLKKTSEVLHRENRIEVQPPGARIPLVQTTRKTVFWPKKQAEHTVLQNAFAQQPNRQHVIQLPQPLVPQTTTMLVYILQPFYAPQSHHSIQNGIFHQSPVHYILRPMLVRVPVPQYSQFIIRNIPAISNNVNEIKPTVTPHIEESTVKEVLKSAETAKVKPEVDTTTTEQAFEVPTAAPINKQHTKRGIKESPSLINEAVDDNPTVFPAESPTRASNFDILKANLMVLPTLLKHKLLQAPPSNYLHVKN